MHHELVAVLEVIKCHIINMTMVANTVGELNAWL